MLPASSVTFAVSTTLAAAATAAAPSAGDEEYRQQRYYGGGGETAVVTAAVSASSVSSSRKKKSAMNYVGAALRLKPVKVTEQVMVYRCLIIYNYLSVYCIALFIIVSVGSGPGVSYMYRSFISLL